MADSNHEEEREISCSGTSMNANTDTELETSSLLLRRGDYAVVIAS